MAFHLMAQKMILQIFFFMSYCYNFGGSEISAESLQVEEKFIVLLVSTIQR